MPDVGPLFGNAGIIDRSVATTPGYQSTSALEAGAPSTPVTLLSAEVQSRETESAANEDQRQRNAPQQPPMKEQTPTLVSAPPRKASLPSVTTPQMPSEEAQAPDTVSPQLPPLPLHIKTKEPLPFAGPLSPSQQEPRSPGAESVASTTLPYAFPTPTHTPPVPAHHFTAEIQEPSPLSQSVDSQRSQANSASAAGNTSQEEEQPTSAKSTSSSSKFSNAMKFKSWASKSSRDRDNAPPALTNVPAPGSTPSEPVKSPHTGFRGLKFWQKEDLTSADSALSKPAIPQPPRVAGMN